MPRKSTTKSAADVTATDDTVAVADILAEENMKATKEVKKENSKRTVTPEPLEDFDEIEIISLIPNVSYKDAYTGDMYEWREVGHIEFMTFETLKRMWRNTKSYFKNMYLKPLDNRVVNKFNLTDTYKKYEFLMNESNYTRKNVDEICESISTAPMGLKFAVCNKISSLVSSEKITDILVIRALEKHLNLDLTSFLN